MLESLNYYKFIMAALNLLILYFVLRKILFKPVNDFMEKRTQSIRDSIDDAEAKKAEALAMRQDYEAQLASAKSEIEKMMDDAAARAEKEHERLIAEARKEAETLVEKTREKLAYERDEMLREVRNQVASLALAAASKVVEANMNTERNKALVEKFKNLLETSAQLESIDEWGKRKLAYEINDLGEGYYVLANFSAESSFPHELERIYKITDGIIKYLVIKKD
jgi:F-type H+-transporting ATPase subunit b